MADGVVAELPELIALKRYAQKAQSQPKGQALRVGQYASTLRGRGMDFAEARNYQAGDEVRHMEWRVTARTGKPHVKIYQEERERPVVLLVDFNPSMIFGTRIAFKSVVAARLASLLAWTVVKQGDRVGGFFFSATQHSEFTPRGRDLGVLPLLASLSHYTQQPVCMHQEQPRMLSDALMRVRRVIRPGSTLILISDFYSMDEASVEHLNRLRAHNDVLAYHISDPLELNPPKPSHYAITNGQQELLLDMGLKKVHKAYEDYCNERIIKLKEQFKRLQIQYVEVTAFTDLAQIVRQTFPRNRHG